MKSKIITMLLISTSSIANAQGLDVSANIEGGCVFSVDTDELNFNSADYTPRTDGSGILSGKYKDVALNILCSKGVSYKIKATDKNTNIKHPFVMSGIDENNSNEKFTYSVSFGGNDIYYQQIQRTSDGKNANFNLRFAISSSSFQPTTGRYAGETVLTVNY